MNHTVSERAVSVRTAEVALSQADICSCFNRIFSVPYQVVLRGGGAEPEYLPPSAGKRGAIIAREDFAASALHEAAHWCIAGTQRRTLRDYGYRYVPPPRGAAGQARFFSLELLPQAVECYLAARAGIGFVASADDPQWPVADVRRFEQEVVSLAAAWESPGNPARPPDRAVRFARALAGHANG